MPCSNSSDPPQHSGKPRPLGYTTSSGPCPPSPSIATRFRGLKSKPPAFANAVRSAVPASFELPPPASLQFLALAPVILATEVVTLPQVPDLEDLAGVLRQAVPAPSPVTTPQDPLDAP